jgi:hypothetical protein
MRRFWGNVETNSLKFSRDDEQILALNYENLCDGDYLTRLFASDHIQSNKEDSQPSSTEATKQAPENNNNAVKDLTEDIIIFGDDTEIGKQFYQRRLQKDISTTNKFLDPLALQINHQVLVFDHMTKLIISRLSSVGALSSAKSTTRQITQNSSMHLHLPSLALRCCLTMIEGENIDAGVICATVKPILQSLINFFNPEIWSNPTHSMTISSEQTKFLRKIFLQCLRKLFLLNKVELSTWHRQKFQQDVTSVLFGIYGYFALGLLGGSSSDILIGVHHLMFLMITAEEKIENMLSALKGMLTSPVANTCHSSNNNNNQNNNNVHVPTTKVNKNVVGNAKVVNKSKQRPSFAPKQEESIDFKILLDTTERNQTDSESCSRMATVVPTKNVQLKEQKERSSTPVTKVGDNQKDVVGRSKLIASKPSKGSEGKMLHEFLEKSGGAIDNFVNNQAIVVANRVIIEPISANKSKSNNRDRESQANRSSKTMSPRTNFKKLEKELKDSLQSSFRLPKVILNMMNDYCTIVDGNLSTKRPSPVAAAKGFRNSSSSKEMFTYVWSCGQNSYGELGLGDVNIRKSFTKISTLDEKSIISIGAGNEHSLFVTKEGKLFTAGYNENGQCGIGSTQQVRQPAVVQALEDEEIQQVFVFNGCEHTVALTRDGKVYSFGYNYRGQVSFY